MKRSQNWGIPWNDRPGRLLSTVTGVLNSAGTVFVRSGKYAPPRQVDCRGGDVQRSDAARRAGLD